MTPTFEGEARVEELQQKIVLLEQGMKQAASVREMWSKAVRELKATKSELKQTVADLTAARDELDRKNASLASLNLQLQEEMAQRERVEVELRLAQKLESIGQLAAGIAHEINTPIQYIGDNTEYLSEAFDAYLELFDKLKPLIEEGVDLTSPIAGVAEVMENGHLADLAEDVPDAIADTLEGVEHVASIVKSMKEFSRRGSEEKVPVDVNHALETTVTVARGEWKRVAEIEWQLAESLPKVHAVGAELNQVFLNLLINAAQAVAEAADANVGGMGKIRIGTQPNETGVVVTISDTGVGIPESIVDYIFDPFFTTKDVGVGSGQGLSIAHSIIVDHHGGKIDVTSAFGAGATFTIWLPMGLPG